MKRIFRDGRPCKVFWNRSQPRHKAGYKKNHRSGETNLERAFLTKHEMEGMNEEVSY